LAELLHDKLQHVVAAHISDKNNTFDLARAALQPVLNVPADEIPAIDQEEGLGWFSLKAWN